MRGLCDCPGIESSQSKKGLGERVCPAASDGEVIYWKRGGSLFIPFFVSPKLFSRIRSYPPINGSAGGITRQGGCISILRPKPAYLVKLKEFPSLASDQPRSRLAPSSYSALSLLLRDLQVESGNESMDGERIFGKARKDFFLLKVGVRSAARTGRDVTSITSGGAILPEQSLKQGKSTVRSERSKQLPSSIRPSNYAKGPEKRGCSRGVQFKGEAHFRTPSLGFRAA
ncbi:hypothetical protein Acr_00g0001460 [Actinidia rufa]|uniref:Uncharacterized protein n=1 Tax=Actinidia rufa TaxID=165716 RepID=A0A7J0D6G4_9ERIC|nr:hypothetical protein Acr_00g0001110 [Actinidia rufa]GFS28382.1 hypothetical protein Acr_00g0001460 [Actinidia rufa]